MLLLRDLPTDADLADMRERYPDLDPGTVSSLLALLRAASDVFLGADAFFSPRKLSCGRFAVLALLNRHPDRRLTPSQIADACGVTRATITGLLDGLEADGHIRRDRAEGDRRTQLVGLTAQGRRFLDDLMPEHFRRIRRLMQGLDARELRQLQKICQRVAASARELHTETTSTP